MKKKSKSILAVVLAILLILVVAAVPDHEHSVFPERYAEDLRSLHLSDGI